jgi:hypothetical protein
LLRQEFEGLRGRVITTVRGRLGASGALLDVSDLDACYAQALRFVVAKRACCASRVGMTW